MSSPDSRRPIEVLLGEDNPGDVWLMREALREGRLRLNLSVAVDGEDTLAFLRRQGKHAGVPRPELILLDLNMPKKGGREVLAEIKADDELRDTPVVVVTGSHAPADVVQSYRLHANAYITKPIDAKAFLEAVNSIEQFWLRVVRLP